MTPEAVTAAGMITLAALDRLPEVARIWAADRKDRRAKAAAKEAGK